MILITGGLGFIGINTARALLDLGESCVLAQRRSGPCPDALAPELGRRVFVEPLDVTDAAALRETCRRHGVTGIVHLAAPGLLEPDPLAVVRAHAAGLLAVVEAARELNLRRISVASSIGVYGGAGAGPWREDMPLALTGDHPIVATKKSAEVLSTYLAGALELSVAVLRIGAIWGPFGRPASRFFALPGLVNAAVRGEPATPAPADDGSDCLYARDCGRAIALVQTAPALRHRVYNIGSGRVTTNAEVVAAITAVVPDADLSVVPGGQAIGPLDVTRLNQDTGFAPAYPVDRAVADYVDWLRAHP